MDVKLLKQNSKYVKDNEEKIAVNYFLQLGNERVPIEVKFFENDEGKDPNYRSRRTLLSAFAESLPDKEPKELESKK